MGCLVEDLCSLRNLVFCFDSWQFLFLLSLSSFLTIKILFKPLLWKPVTFLQQHLRDYLLGYCNTKLHIHEHMCADTSTTPPSWHFFFIIWHSNLITLSQLHSQCKHSTHDLYFLMVWTNVQWFKILARVLTKPSVLTKLTPHIKLLSKYLESR